MPKALDALLRRIMSGNEDIDRGSAIAIAKERDWIKQKGDSLVLTEKGKKAADSAANTLKEKGYHWTGRSWQR